MQSVQIDNFGYALPLNAIMGVIENMLGRANDAQAESDLVTKHGHGYYKCMLGISVAETDHTAVYDEATGTLTMRSTVKVIKVDPASETGGASDGILLENDEILSMEINGVKRDIYRKYQLGDLLAYANKGDIARITVRRGGVVTTVEVPLNKVLFFR